MSRPLKESRRLNNTVALRLDDELLAGVDRLVRARARVTGSKLTRQDVIRSIVKDRVTDSKRGVRRPRRRRVAP